MIIYRILTYVSSITSSICFILLVYHIYQAIRGACQRNAFSIDYYLRKIRDEVQSFLGTISTVILVISLFGTLITNAAVHQILGVHNLKLLPEGTYCFYVEARQYGGKTYTLPAQIAIEKKSVEVSDEKTKTYTYYHIEKVFFSNGGYIDANDGEPDQIGNASYLFDSNDDEWELVLLNEHAYSPCVIETNNAQWIDVIFLLINVLSISIVLFAMCKKENVD